MAEECPKTAFNAYCYRKLESCSVTEMNRIIESIAGIARFNFVLCVDIEYTVVQTH